MPDGRTYAYVLDQAGRAARSGSPRTTSAPSSWPRPRSTPACGLLMDRLGVEEIDRDHARRRLRQPYRREIRHGAGHDPGLRPRQGRLRRQCGRHRRADRPGRPAPPGARSSAWCARSRRSRPPSSRCFSSTSSRPWRSRTGPPRSAGLGEVAAAAGPPSARRRKAAAAAGAERSILPDPRRGSPRQSGGGAGAAPPPGGVDIGVDGRRRGPAGESRSGGGEDGAGFPPPRRATVTPLSRPRVHTPARRASAGLPGRPVWRLYSDRDQGPDPGGEGGSIVMFKKEDRTSSGREQSWQEPQRPATPAPAPRPSPAPVHRGRTVGHLGPAEGGRQTSNPMTTSRSAAGSRATSAAAP